MAKKHNMKKKHKPLTLEELNTWPDLDHYACSSCVMNIKRITESYRQLVAAARDTLDHGEVRCPQCEAKMRAALPPKKGESR